MTSSVQFILGNTVLKTNLAEENTRQIMGFNHDFMLVTIWFEVIVSGYFYQQAYAQFTYIVSRVFNALIDDKFKQLTANDNFYIPANAFNGLVCKQAGIAIDTLNSVRDDFSGESSD